MRQTSAQQQQQVVPETAAAAGEREIYGVRVTMYFFFQFRMRGYRLRAPKSGDGVRISYLYLIVRDLTVARFDP